MTEHTRRHDDDQDQRVTRESIDALRSSIDTLGRQMDRADKALQRYAPRHEVDDAITAKVAGLGAQVDASLAVLEDSVADAQTAAALATAAAARVNGYTRTTIKRFRRLGRLMLAGAVTAMLAGVLVAPLVADVHAHRAHVDPLQDRIAAVEGRTPATEAGFDTHALPPLFPAAQQDAAPVGVYFLAVVTVLLGVSAGLVVRLWVLVVRNGDNG